MSSRADLLHGLYKELENQEKHCPVALLVEVLQAFGFTRDRDAISHQVFRDPNGLKITVPCSSAVKNLYMEHVLAILQQVLKEEDLSDDKRRGGGAK